MLRICSANGLGEPPSLLHLVAAKSARETQPADHYGVKNPAIAGVREGRGPFVKDRIDLTGLPTGTRYERETGDFHAPVLQLTVETNANLRWTDGSAAV